MGNFYSMEDSKSIWKSEDNSGEYFSDLRIFPAGGDFQTEMSNIVQ
jgi:hypothetical protein